MAAVRNRAGPSNGYGTSGSNNKQAHVSCLLCWGLALKRQLATAYQDLAKELASDKLKVVGGYTLGRVIGEGTYGSVHIATHRLTGTRCAVKKVPKGVTAQLTREIHHHRRLHHPHILHLHEILATESHVWLVSELCTGGELFDYLVERGRILEGEARRLFGEMAVAVGFMHRQGVVHRDLKLENILLDGELRVKLCDLGFVRENTDGRMLETFCGTTGYASPEMLAGRKYLGPETDIWSLGIILYTLLSGGLPFDDDNEAVIRDLIQRGEYGEPEWLSPDAKSLIRGMLQLDPSQRLSIEKILKHRWFQHTLIDSYENVTSEVRSYPSSPNLSSQPIIEGQEGFFSDAWRKESRLSPGLASGMTSQSPLSLNVPVVAKPAAPESEASETSAPSIDSDRPRKNSGDTTPTTIEDEIISPTPMMRSHSGQDSEVEKLLEMMHSNASQSTIRKSEADSPGASSLMNFRAKVAARSSLEGQAEVDEEAVTDSSRPASAVPLPAIDETGYQAQEHPALLHVAQHSRTPSRTKRRSVSSTLSLERKHSHQSTSGQYQTYGPEDFLAELNAVRPAVFSTPSERHLLGQLVDLGFDTGQLMHSVKNDACDASAATWWILRQKQVERGETDEVIEAKQAAIARRRERAAAHAREERRRLREHSTSRDPSPEEKASVAFKDEQIIPSTHATPSVTIMDLGAPLMTTNKPFVASPEQVPVSVMPANKAIATPEAQRFEKPLPPIKQEGSLPVPATPPRDSSRNGTPVSQDEDSPRRLKNRTPSTSMLRRATSVWSGRKTDEKGTPGDASPALSTDSKGRTSPNKLTKALPTPMTKLPRPDQDISPMTVPRGSPAQAQTGKVQLEAGPSRTVQPDSKRHSVSSHSSAGLSASPGKGKGVKREISLWQSFRNYFNEDKRRRKREFDASADHVEIKPIQTLVVSRGVHARVAHPNRTNQPAMAAARRASQDVRRPGYSRRSSSATSRRSSATSLHFYPDASDPVGPGYGRSRRNDGTATPTSDRENPHSRPHSAQSAQSFGHGSKQRSATQILRSPSLQSNGSGRYRSSVTSPLHDYHRRPPSGSASSRIRHIRVIQEHIGFPRTGSIQSNASSARSAASSRRSSLDHGRIDTDREQSDYDSARDDASFRTKRRRSSDRRSSLAHQIHRSRSPFSQSRSHHERRGSNLRPKPLRDVFQQKKDEDWVSDDEEGGPGFAGGLGQNGTGHEAEKGSNWASRHPSAKQGTPEPGSKRTVGKAHKGVRDGRQGRRGEHDALHPSDPKGGTVVAEDGQVRRRAQLPAARGLAPPTIQEDEEDEEDSQS